MFPEHGEAESYAGSEAEENVSRLHTFPPYKLISTLICFDCISIIYTDKIVQLCKCWYL